MSHFSLPEVHTLSILVNNQAGVLMRICQVFARRGYNIDSLVVSKGSKIQFSRMTIGLIGERAGLGQIVKQLDKLIDVIHCFEHNPTETVVKELMFVKFLVKQEDRTEALQVIDHFEGETLDLTSESMIVMFTGESEKMDSVLEMLKEFEIIETVRTGKVIMARGQLET